MKSYSKKICKFQQNWQGGPEENLLFPSIFRKFQSWFKTGFELAARYSQFANANSVFANAKQSILRMATQHFTKLWINVILFLVNDIF